MFVCFLCIFIEYFNILMCDIGWMNYIGNFENKQNRKDMFFEYELNRSISEIIFVGKDRIYYGVWSFCIYLMNELRIQNFVYFFFRLLIRVCFF